MQSLYSSHITHTCKKELTSINYLLRQTKSHLENKFSLSSAQLFERLFIPHLRLKQSTTYFLQPPHIRIDKNISKYEFRLGNQIQRVSFYTVFDQIQQYIVRYEKYFLCIKKVKILHNIFKKFLEKDVFSRLNALIYDNHLEKSIYYENRHLEDSANRLYDYDVIIITSEWNYHSLMVHLIIRNRLEIEQQITNLLIKMYKT